MGHPAANHRPQSGNGFGCGLASGIWNLFIPGEGSAAVRHAGGWRSGRVSHHRHRGKIKFCFAFQITGGIGETTAASSVVELIGLTEEIGAAVRAKAQDDFEAIGMALKTFYIGNLKPSSKSAQELRDMGMLDMATYTQLQAADAMRDAAQNPSGGAGLTAGIGAGMGIGNLMSDALQRGARGSEAGAAAPSSAPPPVMTPSEAASYMKVAEEDVVAAIEAGQLKAKKIGNAYRISKEALDDFLKA